MTTKVPNPLKTVTGLPNIKTDSQIKKARLAVLATLKAKNYLIFLNKCADNNLPVSYWTNIIHKNVCCYALKVKE